MHQLISHYQTLGFESYYDIIISNIQKNSTEFIQSGRFLSGWKAKEKSNKMPFACKSGDTRIDVPVWFGDKQKAKNRILVFGLEPRDTDSNFNIERVGKKVFATPFGVDRWNQKSTVPRKPQNKYYRVFDKLVSDQNNFVVFSDIVKEYEIQTTSNEKSKNDKNARKQFFVKAEESLPFLLQEIKHIAPTHIITMGKDSNEFMLESFKSWNIIRMRHPSNGGEKEAKALLNNAF